jgi:multidrug efflux pump subunit AcrB
MNLAELSISKRTVTLVLTVVMIGGGIQAFNGMSRLEDPEFTIKDALVITPYPGASAAEVEEEVTDRLEKAIQQLGQLDELESKSDRGLSTITVSIKKKYDSASLPQVWDELRRKVGDAQSSLPPGTGPSIVVDDYGDVFGVFVVVYGDEYTYAELKEVVDLLRRELVLVQDVAKVETYGELTEAVYVVRRTWSPRPAASRWGRSSSPSTPGARSARSSSSKRSCSRGRATRRSSCATWPT